MLSAVALLALSMPTVVSLDYAEEESPSVPTAPLGDSKDESSSSSSSADAPTCNAPTCEGDFQPDLPDFTNGGIFVYFHLYKTGGSSITELMVELKDEFEEEFAEDDKDGDDAKEAILFVNNREDMTDEDIENSVAMVKDKKIPIFYNFHVEFPATMYPTFVEAAPVLDHWREYAEAEGVPFFAMTVLREPLGQALSFFNFFHVAVDEDMDWNPFLGAMEPTEENFLKTYVPNRLCHLMYDDAHGILEAPDEALREGLKDNLYHFMDEEEMNRRNEPSFCNVDVVRKILFEDTIFDYVGVTERLSKTILPLITKVVFGDHSLAIGAEQKKKVTHLFDEEDKVVPLRKHALSESTKEMVARESAKDQQLYEEARDRFDHWPQYL